MDPLNEWLTYNKKMDPLAPTFVLCSGENGPFECMAYFYLLKENGPSCFHLCFMLQRKWPLLTILDASPKKMAYAKCSYLH